jgi:uncharacterized protein YbjT (DUF2867 family)
MRILLTGATGYVGRRLLPVLLEQGHEVVCCVRDKQRFKLPGKNTEKVEVLEVDFLDPASTSHIPDDIDAAYYLIHSMATSTAFQDLERQCAINFREALAHGRVQQVIYLSGIINEDGLSEHLASRKMVEEQLALGTYALTTLRAGIIIGSGSASFEIIRDLVEKLPVMIAPRWLRTRCQPIGIRDVISFLVKTVGRSETFDRSFDIGGPDILTYKEMLLGYARARGLRRWIGIVPVMTPRLSSYWLYFITSISYKLAIALVDSMKVEVVCNENDLQRILDITPASYMVSLERALNKIEAQDIASSWTDALASSMSGNGLNAYYDVPEHGCFTDRRVAEITDRDQTLQRVWTIGGSSGWYYANWMWRLRGVLDKLIGGVGLRRGRTHPNHISAGNALDFWRVLHADKDEGWLVLFAEMKLPGEAWLEFRVTDEQLRQTATFRPKGVLGRLYWYAVYPLHMMVFRRMAQALAQ